MRHVCRCAGSCAGGADLLCGVRPEIWRGLHKLLVSAITVTTALHVIPIEGTMEIVTKFLVLVMLIAALAMGLRATR